MKFFKKKPKKPNVIEGGRFYTMLMDCDMPNTEFKGRAEVGYFWRHSQVRKWASATHNRTHQQVRVYTGNEDNMVVYIPE